MTREHTFRRVGSRHEAERLIKTGWILEGGHLGADYENHLMKKTARDDAPAGEDSHGGE